MKKKLLIVNKKTEERSVLSGYLGEIYDIFFADDKEQVISIFNNDYNHYLAVLIDVDLSCKNCYEIMSYLHNSSCYSKIPVVISSSIEDEDTREKAIAYGAIGFVTKPYNQTILLHTVKNAIQFNEMTVMVNTLWRDRLTGLLNRESFFAEVERIVKKHEPSYFVLSSLNIDNFKLINDQFGIKSGDEVLKHVAICLNDFVTGTNGIVCRYSSDRFAILYPKKLMDSDRLKESHLLAMSPICINRCIRIRIGRYVINEMSLSPITMFDRALLAEKSIKGRYDTYISFYDSSMRNKIIREQKLVSEVDNALINGEFETWFQPQYNHSTGAMIGAEALVRWNKNGEMIPPNEFIPIFEKNGFIYKLDQYVWRQVCIFLRKIIDSGKKPLPISVNISRYDILQNDFYEVLCSLVKKYKLSVDLLRIEVTESAFAESTKTIINTVNELIKFGFTVEIDDFGSGYSSLNTLKDVPASILKLDMNFLDDKNDSKRGGSILESIVRMGRWLGMSVIAEGVETIEQADYLKSIGSNYIQGFLYAKPMSLNNFEQHLYTNSIEFNIRKLKTVDSLDNNMFWDPKSMETIVFNSYVGGACIFEYSLGKIELLRYNNKYEQILKDCKISRFFSPDFDFFSQFDCENEHILRLNIKKSIDTKKESSCEVSFYNDRLEKIFFSITVRTIAKSGDSYLFYCVLVNITDQRVAEQIAIEASNKMNNAVSNADFELKTLLRVIPSGILKYSADEKGEFEYINHNFIKGLGYTEEQFRVKFHNCFREMIYEADRAHAEEEIIIQEKNGDIGKFDYRIEAADGRLHWFHDEGVKVTDFNGKTWYYVTLVDITERKEAEEKLKLSEEEYRLALRHIRSTICRYNIKEQVLSVKQNTLSGDIINKCIHNVPYANVSNGEISADTSKVYVDFYESIMNGCKENTVTYQRLIANQWRTIYEHATTIFDEFNNPIYAVISFSDITDENKELKNDKNGTHIFY